MRKRRFYNEPPRKVAIAWSMELDGYVIRSPYNEGFLKDIKEDIRIRVSPRFNGPLKAWIVNEIDITVALELVAKHYGPDYIFEAKPDFSQSGFTNTASANGHNYYKRLFELAGPDLASRFWKQILQKNHPDVGGSNEAASSCNVAWDKIKSELNWR